MASYNVFTVNPRKDVSFLINVWNQSIQFVAFDKTKGSSPYIKESFGIEFVTFFLSVANKVLESKEEISIPMSVNKYDIKKRGMVLQCVITISRKENKTFELLIVDKNNNRLEIPLMLTTNISVGTSPLPEEQRSLIAFKDFIKRLESVYVLRPLSKETQTGGPNSGGHKSSTDNSTQEVSDNVDISSLF